MKVGGQRLVQKNYQAVVIKRGTGDGAVEFTFHVAPLPMGWEETMQSRGVMDWPSPPRDILRDEHKVPILNPESRQVEYVENFRDPRFRTKMNACTQRVDALRFMTHLRDDSGVEFDAVPPSGKDAEDKNAWKKYAFDLFREITEAGFTDDELNAVLKAGSDVGAVINVDEAVNDFLPRSHGSKRSPTTEVSLKQNSETGGNP